MKYTIRSIVCEASCHPVIRIIWIIRVIQVIWLIWVIQVIQVIWVIRASFSTLPLTDKLTNNIRTYRFASQTTIQTADPPVSGAGDDSDDAEVATPPCPSPTRVKQQTITHSPPYSVTVCSVTTRHNTPPL